MRHLPKLDGKIALQTKQARRNGAGIWRRFAPPYTRGVPTRVFCLKRYFPVEFAQVSYGISTFLLVPAWYSQSTAPRPLLKIEGTLHEFQKTLPVLRFWVFPSCSKLPEPFNQKITRSERGPFEIFHRSCPARCLYHTPIAQTPPSDCSAFVT